MFVDTPGIHRPLHRLNVRMVDAAVETLREVDVVALVVDGRAKPRAAAIDSSSDLLQDVKAPVVLVLNKVDLVQKERCFRSSSGSSRDAFADIVPVSAATGENVDDLEKVLLAHLPEGEPLYPADYLTDQPERYLVAEMVREQVLHHTRDELPFSTAVVVDQFEEPGRERPARASTARFWSSATSQKPIVIGRRGAMIKAIGTAARKELERFFDEGVPRPARQGARGMARERTHPGRARPADEPRPSA